LPKEYSEIDHKLGEIRDSDKILILPITGHFVGYVSNDDGYAGPERLYTLTDKTFLTKIHSVVMPEKYSEILDKMRLNNGLVNNFYNILGYRYLLVEKNTISSKHFSVAKYEDIVATLDEKLWDKKFENKSFILYSLKKDELVRRVYVEDGSLIFQKNNDTKYSMNIKIDKKTKLNFIETFNKNWMLYLNPISGDDKCVPIVQDSDHFSSECVSDKNVFSLDWATYFFKKAVFNDKHNLVYDYANQWTIDPDYIKQNFPKEYYTENSDGSINVEMTLYFKPQSYYYLGLLISGFTLLGIIGYFVYDIRKRKNLSKNEAIIYERN
jgi:hypothetical protein